jgi:hypothetical protein
VELVQVDAIGAQPGQARLERLAHERAVPALAALALGMLAATRAQLVPELRRELDLVAVGGEHPPHELLVGPTPVRVAGVEERDPELERAPQQALAVVFADFAPPARAQRPGPEADLRGFEVRVSEPPCPHPAQSK